jgi:hypothetical protein
MTSGGPRRVVARGQPGGDWPLAKADQNTKCYEQTHHVIENKGQEFPQANRYLKNKSLLRITQQVMDSKTVECFGGSIAQSFVISNGP